MIDPATLRTALVNALKDIPALVSALGNSAANIEEYVEQNEGDLFSKIASLKAPRLLVLYNGTGFAGGTRELWRHTFSLIVAATGSPTAVFALVVNGVPASGGNTRVMLEYPIHAQYHQMEVPQLSRRVIPVSESSSFDYWEITTAYVSRGYE